MGWHGRFFGLVLGALLLGGCSSSSPPSDAGSDAGDAGSSCASFAATFCDYLNQCQPGNLQAQYGSVGNCTAMRTADCTLNLAAPGSGVTPSFLSACSASLTTSASACSSKPVPGAVETPTDPCAVVGAGAGGAACGVAAQCATDVCERVGTLCGRCTAAGKLGEGCNDATGVTCARGLTCSASTGTCVTEVASGASCDLGVTTACVPGTNCVVAKAGDTSGTCQPSGVTAGAPCDHKSVGVADCWAGAGFFCDGTNHCAAITYGAPAATCTGAPTSTSDQECAAGSCVAGACAGNVAAGQACTLDADPICVGGTTCVVGGGGVTGTCTSVTSSCTTAPPLVANFGFQPSNISMTAINAAASTAADEVISSACTIQTDATNPQTTCFTSPINAVKQAGGSTVNLVVVRSLSVQPSTIVTATGSVPLVIVSLSDIVWFGQLAASSSSSSLAVGAGGAAAAGVNAVGPGSGGGKAASSTALIGAGGGSYCGVGGAGGGTTTTTPAYGSPDVRPLVGGSSGGGGAAGGGAGGGGVQFVAAGAIFMKQGSSITVGGQGGPSGGVAADQNAGGGGSGGSILLEAQNVVMNGTLAANGGGGGGDYSKTAGDATVDATAALGAAGAASGAGGGNGAAGATIDGAAGKTSAGINSGGGGGAVGRIRVNTVSGTATGAGVYSPATTTTCASQGTVRALGSGA